MDQKYNVYAYAQTRRSAPGTDQYAQASQLMSEITERVKRASALAFSQGACEVTPAAWAAQVSEELTAIDESMRQISDLVLESTAAVEALEFNADQLAQSIARFKAALTVCASHPGQPGR